MDQATKQALYKAGAYSFPAPPVQTTNWNDQDWIDYIDAHGKWQKIRTLTCCCCGEYTKGRQWWNRDQGFGLCDRCADWIGGRESAEEMLSCYGVEGVHYKITD